MKFSHIYKCIPYNTSIYRLAFGLNYTAIDIKVKKPIVMLLKMMFSMEERVAVGKQAFKTDHFSFTITEHEKYCVLRSEIIYGAELMPEQEQKIVAKDTIDELLTYLK